MDKPLTCQHCGGLFRMGACGPEALRYWPNYCSERCRGEAHVKALRENMQAARDEADRLRSIMRRVVDSAYETMGAKVADETFTAEGGDEWNEALEALLDAAYHDTTD